MAGDHDDWEAYPRVTNFRNQFNPGHFGHLIVGQEQIIMFNFNRFPSRRPIYGEIDGKTSIYQYVNAKLASIIVIINDQNMSHGVYLRQG